MCAALNSAIALRYCVDLEERAPAVEVHARLRGVRDRQPGHQAEAQADDPEQIARVAPTLKYHDYRVFLYVPSMNVSQVLPPSNEFSSLKW